MKSKILILLFCLYSCNNKDNGIIYLYEEPNGRYEVIYKQDSMIFRKVEGENFSTFSFVQKNGEYYSCDDDSVFFSVKRSINRYEEPPLHVPVCRRTVIKKLNNNEKRRYRIDYEPDEDLYATICTARRDASCIKDQDELTALYVYDKNYKIIYIWRLNFFDIYKIKE